MSAGFIWTTNEPFIFSRYKYKSFATLEWIIKVHYIRYSISRCFSNKINKINGNIIRFGQHKKFYGNKYSYPGMITYLDIFSSKQRHNNFELFCTKSFLSFRKKGQLEFRSFIFFLSFDHLQTSFVRALDKNHLLLCCCITY